MFHEELLRLGCSRGPPRWCEGPPIAVVPWMPVVFLKLDSVY